MKKLRMKKGLAGVGLYWCLVELLFESGGYMETANIPILAFDLGTTEDDINDLLNEYDLFSIEENRFYSSGVLKRLQIREEKSEKARSSINYRWKKCKTDTDESKEQNGSNTNVLQTYYDPNTIKEKKSKVNKSTIAHCNANALAHFDAFWSAYPKKRDRTKAKAVFSKMNVDEGLLAEILKAIERQKHSPDWTKDNGQFIPYPTTWLSGRRWEDEPEEPGAGESTPRIELTDEQKQALREKREKQDAVYIEPE